VGAVVPRAVGSLSVLAALGVELGMEPEVDQRVGVRARDDEDGAAVTAVAAARPASRDELLAAEREAAAPAMSGFYVDIDFVYNHRVIWRFGDCGDCNRVIAITRSPNHEMSRFIQQG